MVSLGAREVADMTLHFKHIAVAVPARASHVLP